MNKDKIIKDLKERNDKLANQYRLRDIRCVHLGNENDILKSRVKKAIVYIRQHTQKYDIDGSIGDCNSFDVLAKPKHLLEILGGDVDDE